VSDPACTAAVILFRAIHAETRPHVCELVVREDSRHDGPAEVHVRIPPLSFYLLRIEHEDHGGEVLCIQLLNHVAEYVGAAEGDHPQRKGVEEVRAYPIDSLQPRQFGENRARARCQFPGQFGPLV
jgi:L-ascorbate metabolism protein UlaG (beta-lactamase superfamily)